MMFLFDSVIDGVVFDVILCKVEEIWKVIGVIVFFFEECGLVIDVFMVFMML